jgi:hypothetical protein
MTTIIQQPADGVSAFLLWTITVYLHPVYDLTRPTLIPDEPVHQLQAAGAQIERMTTRRIPFMALQFRPIFYNTWSICAKEP